MTTPHALDTDQARTRLHELIVLDVRTPGEYATGHLPGALNIPLDHLDHALPDIRHAAQRGDLLVVCASGARSENACHTLAAHGITTATLTGGKTAWAADGHTLHHPDSARRTAWNMERQVRLTVSAVVLTGLALGRLHPAFRLASAGVAMAWSTPPSPTPAAWPPSSPNSPTTVPTRATSTQPSPPSG